MFLQLQPIWMPPGPRTSHSPHVPGPSAAGTAFLPGPSGPPPYAVFPSSTAAPAAVPPPGLALPMLPSWACAIWLLFLTCVVGELSLPVFSAINAHSIWAWPVSDTGACITSKLQTYLSNVQLTSPFGWVIRIFVLVTPKQTNIHLLLSSNMCFKHHLVSLPVLL